MEVATYSSTILFTLGLCGVTNIHRAGELFLSNGTVGDLGPGLGLFLRDSPDRCQWRPWVIKPALENINFVLP